MLLFPSALVLFFSTAKRKEPKESAAFCPTAPRGKRLALRCFAVRFSASWRWHLSYRLPDDWTIFQRVTAWSLSGHGNHIYGNMKAPSWAEHLLFIERFSILSLPGAQIFFWFSADRVVAIENQWSALERANISQENCAKTSHLLPKNCAPASHFLRTRFSKTALHRPEIVLHFG